MKAWIGLLLSAATCFAQDFTQRGFLENRLTLYPQTAPRDSGRLVGEALFRYEASYKISPSFRFSGAVDARVDTHHQVERDWKLSWQDRDVQRPSISVRRLSAIYHRGPVTLELGKQFVRWGKTDILNPTDRFAPRDFLGVVDNEFLGVNAARFTYERGADTVDLVWASRFTPSRMPLFNQRWVVRPEGLPPDFEVLDSGARYPGGPQFGVRWNRVGAVEYAVSFYEGYNHLPLFDARLRTFPLRVEIQRFYPKIRMIGGDTAIPLGIFTIKGEAAYFASPRGEADEYVLYVIQLERQAGEWFLIGGYAGQVVTTKTLAADFAPDRGLTRALLGRAGYTIDANRNIALETAVRESGKGIWLKFEYSQAFGQHWRATYAFTLIRGSSDDFLGQYRLNSHATLLLRYSF